MIGTAKNKSFFPPALSALWTILFLVVALFLPETRVWGFAATPQPASGVYASVTPSSIGENYDCTAYDASDSLLAAKAAPKLLGPGTSFGAKIEVQLAGRGWTKDLVQSAIDKPTRTVPWTDTRHLPGGGRMNDPATAFYGPRGGYVVRNNRTGDIIQVSDRTNPGWKAPWD